LHFDQSKLAEELLKEMGKQIRMDRLPFNSFEFV